MIMVDNEIRDLIEKKQMIEKYADLKTQLQPNGFDLTLHKVFEFHCLSDGMQYARIDFNNENRKISAHVEVFPDDDNLFQLQKGVYLFRAREFFRMPNNVVSWGMPRSSLSRCGATLDSAIADCGYTGHLVFVVTLNTRMIFDIYARFVQMIFFRLDNMPDKCYNGVYKEK